MENIKYIVSTETIKVEQLNGFFVGWALSPNSQKLMFALNSAKYKVLAINIETNSVIGFTYAITDNFICAYIPLVEVLPDFQNKGIGKNLITKLLSLLQNYYMIDLCCDELLTKYYEKLNFNKVSGMIIRNYNKQQGIE